MGVLPDGSSLVRVLHLGLVAVIALMQSKAAIDAHESSAPVPTKEPPSVFVLVYVSKHPGVANLDEYRRKKAGSLKSPSILNAALKEPKVAELKVVKEQAKPADWLAEQLRIDEVGDTGMFKLHLAGGSPREQATILNALMRGYDRLYYQRERTYWADTLEVYKRSLPGEVASLRSSEARLSPDELANLPKQLNRDEYVKSMEKEIANKKNGIKKTEEGIENAERQLRVLPLIKVLEWAEVPARK